MAPEIIVKVIPDDYYGQRMDLVLVELFPDYSRSQLTQWLKEGFITADDQLVKPKNKVQGGEVVRFELPQSKAEVAKPESIPLTIIFEDEHLLVINKPAGLVVHPGAGNPDGTLLNALLHHERNLQQLPRAGIIHRLDKDTTGLMVIAKSYAAHTHLVQQLQARVVERHYLALVYGRVISGGTLETYYGRHPRNRLKMAVLLQGKDAITEYTVVQRYQGFTLLDVRLKTGRTHQIRVHMSHIHHPLVGDQLYLGRIRYPRAASLELRSALEQFQRQALHAHILSFKHPVNGQVLTFNAPLPQDFQDLLNVLESNDDGHTG